MEMKEEMDCSFDDDEVFFGRLTLKEVKKRIFMDVHQKYMSKLACCNENEGNFGSNEFKLIETSSEPNMLVAGRDRDELTVENLKSTSDPNFNKDKCYIERKLKPDSDCESSDSFLEIEKNVTEQCQTPFKCENNLDNTLEFVDFILKHAPSTEKGKHINAENTTKEEVDKQDSKCFKDDDIPKDENMSQSSICNKKNPNEEHSNIEKSICPSTTPMNCNQLDTPLKSKNINLEVPCTYNTPINKKEASNLFKTPKIPLSGRKDFSGKKTPSRSKAYEHIASPIATYIRHCPQVPLVKDVHPKKPLPHTSFIPKLLKNAPEGKSDKENVMLPQLAYRNAKKTLVIDVNKEKLPQSNWAQKLTTVPQKPVVLKHNHRKTGEKPLLLQQEDSFQDLSLHQADVSVCTQKLAFHK